MQSAAYITGEKLYETRRDMHADYQNRRHDVGFFETLIPDHIPSELQGKFNTLKVWDVLESFEDDDG